MASFTLCLFLFVLVHGLILLPYAVHCNEQEDSIFKGINDYRSKTLNLSELTKNEKADCLADKIATELQDQPCSTADDFSKGVDTDPELINLLNKLFKKCHINPNTTMDGVILPVCVPKLELSFVLNNYTRSDYVKYLNDSSYSGAGVGSEEDWMVLILSTNSSTGSFSGSGASSLVANVGFFQCFVGVFLGLVVLVSL